MGIEGDGNDVIFLKFGWNVVYVYWYWEVWEEDYFLYFGYKGLFVIDLEWGFIGKGKVVRVVYLVEMIDGFVEFYILECVDVVKNLIVYIN